MTGLLLNWGNPKDHWSGRDLACITCRESTWLLNDDKKPQHKVCAEKVHEQRAAFAAARYRRDQFNAEAE